MTLLGYRGQLGRSWAVFEYLSIFEEELQQQREREREREILV